MRLSLKKETLTEITPDALRAVMAGAGSGSCTSCVCTCLNASCQVDEAVWAVKRATAPYLHADC